MTREIGDALEGVKPGACRVRQQLRHHRWRQGPRRVQLDGADLRPVAVPPAQGDHAVDVTQRERVALLANDLDGLALEQVGQDAVDVASGERNVEMDCGRAVDDVEFGHSRTVSLCLHRHRSRASRAPSGSADQHEHDDGDDHNHGNDDDHAHASTPVTT